MKKFITAFAFVAASVLAQTTAVTVSTNVNTAYLKDLEQYRLTLFAPVSNEGGLTVAQLSTDTTLTIQNNCPANGVAIMVDQGMATAEAELVTGGVGTHVCTVTRNAVSALLGTSAQAHSIAGPVMELQIANLTAMAKYALGYFCATIASPALGAKSFALGSAVTALQNAQAAVATVAPSSVAQ